MNDQLHAPAALLPGKNPLCPLSPRAGMDVLGNTKISSFFPDSSRISSST